MARKLSHTIWMGMRITHPQEWEPIKLDLDARHGRCTLVDQYDERLDVHWRPSKATPDVRRIMEHHQRKARAGNEASVGGLRGWEGFARQDGKRTVVQAARWFESAHRLVELAVVWPDGHDKSLERRILDGIGPDLPSDGRRIWQVLGLSVSVPAGTPMKSYLAQPGKVEFVFRPRGGLLTVSRLTLAGGWLTKSLPDWLEFRSTGARLAEARACTVNGHEGFERLTSTFAAAPALLGRRRWRRERAWICPACDRLFVSGWECTSRQPRPMPDVQIGCCSPLSVPPDGG